MNPKILVVDDEPDFLELLRLNLSGHGYDVLEARSGLEALHQAQRHPPDLIILDLMMDDINGYTVCEVLRRQRSTQKTPIIMLTALFGQLTRANCLAAGANDFIVKPFNPADLLRRVRMLMHDHPPTEQVANEARESPLTRARAGF